MGGGGGCRSKEGCFCLLFKMVASGAGLNARGKERSSQEGRHDLGQAHPSPRACTLIIAEKIKD